MALIQVNAADKTASGFEHVVPAMERLSSGQSVTIMTHGLRFSPFVAEKDPHTHILSFTPRACWKAVSWPKHLHLNRAGAGLGIAFGWHALGPLRHVAQRAFDAGSVLARLIAVIHARRPDLRVNLMAHSLGARVVLRAMALAPEGSIRRVIVMSGAEYRSVAQAAMAAPGASRAHVLNVCSRENAVFDGLFRVTVPAPHLTDRTLSAGLPWHSNWCDLRVDHAETQTMLRRLGIRTHTSGAPVCHWSTYLRPGLFKLYRRVLDPTEGDLLLRFADEGHTGPSAWQGWRSTGRGIAMAARP